ncbi:hypothetical protein GLOIN_2v1779246 [Rhizophagus clarus]|uniref:Uncharacterized protein n=1 Tax=Rhizophagus clarus TaxID=94130 RepID=A0A8H3KTA8_9GLOM|nr:hypothetical protein GLOIN_2v1779246 [Rhizophagus clarus]
MPSDIVEWIKKNGGDWKGKIVTELIEKSFINDLLNAIWYVNICDIEKMKRKAIHSPKEEEFFNRSDLSSYKNSRSQFDKLTGDSNATSNMNEKQIILRTKQLFVNKDDKMIIDLHNFNKAVKVSEYYTGKLALFQYEKEMAVKYKEYLNLVFLGNKHQCKVGELNHSVAAVK